MVGFPPVFSQTWRIFLLPHYNAQSPSIRHMGAIAQDFRSACGLGEDEKHVSAVDADGVTLAAIQALYRLTQVKDGEIRDLQQIVEQLQSRLLNLEQRATHVASTNTR